MFQQLFLSNNESNQKCFFFFAADAKGLEDSSTVMLEPTLDCEIRFGYFSKKFRKSCEVN